MKKNITIFIMLGFVGLACSQLEGLTRKEFARLRQLEEQLDARIKAGVQGDTQDWFAESDVILQEIKQLDPKSSVPFEKKLIKQSKWAEQAGQEWAEQEWAGVQPAEQEWAEQAGQEVANVQKIVGFIQGNIEVSKKRIGYFNKSIEEARDEGIEDVADLLGSLTSIGEDIIKEKLLIGEENYNQLIESIESLSVQVKEIALDRKDDLEKKMATTTGMIKSKLKEAQGPNFGWIEEYVLEIKNDINFLKEGLSSKNYDQLSDSWFALNKQLTKAQETVPAGAQQQTAESEDIFNDINKKVETISLAMLTAKTKIQYINIQVGLVKKEPPEYLFSTFLEEIKDLSSELTDSKDKFTGENFATLNDSIKGLFKDLANYVFTNAVQFIDKTKEDLRVAVEDIIKTFGTKMDLSLTPTIRFEKAIKVFKKEIMLSLQLYLLIANQKGLLQNNELEGANLNEYTSFGLARLKLAKSIFNQEMIEKPTFEGGDPQLIEKNYGFFAELTKVVDKRLGDVDQDKKNKEELREDTFDQIVLFIRMMHELVIFYEVIETFLGKVENFDKFKDIMKKDIVDLKTKFYNLFEVTSDKKEGIIGQRGKNSWGDILIIKRTQDGLKGIGPTVEEIEKARSE